MPGETLKQFLSAHTETLQRTLRVGHIVVYEESSCSVEPCLNFQKCVSKVKFEKAGAEFLRSTRIQLRPILVRHELGCECPVGFTGTKSSMTCDLEINLCYSNPCGNNAACLSIESGFVCICDPGFTGRLCDIDLNIVRCCDRHLSPLTLPPSQLNPVARSPLKAPVIESFNNKINRTLHSKCVSSGEGVSSVWSAPSDGDQVCQGGSQCKNLILGGILCDKCGTNAVDKSFFNNLCELRAKHFPAGANAFLALPGIQSRHRFKVQLTFATTKPSSFIFHNGRIDSSSDFIALKLDSGYLSFVYSLGGAVQELKMDDLAVSDGKWRTVTVEYRDRRVSLSLDDDDSMEVDSCRLARSERCHRRKAEMSLDLRCLNQMETCFRFLDLGGPLMLGRGKRLVSSFYFEGCIGDVFIDDKLVDLDKDTLADFSTEPGCVPKLDQCKLRPRNQCTICRHAWAEQAKCECANDDQFVEGSFCTQNARAQVFSLNGMGFIALHFNSTQLHSQLSFYIKLSPNERTVVLASLGHGKDRSVTLRYSSSQQRVELWDEAQVLFNTGLVLHDGFWNKIEIKFSSELILAINNLIEFKSELKYSFDKVLIGSQSSSFVGCVKNVPFGLVNVEESQNVSFGCQIKVKPLFKIKNEEV